MNIEALHIVGFVGFLVAITISVYFWERVLFRFIPFVYASAFAIARFDNPSESIFELLKVIAALNLATGVMLFSAWLQIREEDRPDPPVSQTKETSGTTIEDDPKRSQSQF